MFHTFFLDKTGLKCGLPADKEISLPLLRFFSPPDRRPVKSDRAEEHGGGRPSRDVGAGVFWKEPHAHDAGEEQSLLGRE